jgi:hypothetical protein
MATFGRKTNKQQQNNKKSFLGEKSKLFSIKKNSKFPRPEAQVNLDLFTSNDTQHFTFIHKIESGRSNEFVEKIAQNVAQPIFAKIMYCITLTVENSEQGDQMSF